MGKTEKVFPHIPEHGDFSAYHDAVKWVEGLGFSVGSMQRGAPTAIFRGDCDVSKWRNLRDEDHEELAGTIIGVGGRFRGGPVTVTLFGYSEPERSVDRPTTAQSQT